MSDTDTPSEPQRISFSTEVGFGESRSYGSDWIAYALQADAPQIAGVDPSRNPAWYGGDEGGTAYA